MASSLPLVFFRTKKALRKQEKIFDSGRLDERKYRCSGSNLLRFLSHEQADPVFRRTGCMHKEMIMTVYCEEWMKNEYTCSECSWSGTGGETARGTMYRGKFLELSCPSCSEFLDVLILPEEKGCAHSREGLTEEQLKAIAEAEEQERLYREMCLTSADQLPPLAEGDVTLNWDMEQGETQIRNGETVIWSEPVVYEGFDRFEQVALILKEKYGNRLKDLVPTDRSKLFLYGDYEPSLGYLKKVRKNLFGVDAEI